MPNGSEDPFGKQYDTEPYIDTAKDYELEEVDRKSLSEIRVLIKENKYKDPAYIRDHIEYLEDLLQKLIRISLEEKKSGKLNLTLEHDISRIKELFAQLQDLLDKLES